MLNTMTQRPPKTGARYAIQNTDNAKFLRDVRDIYSKDAEADMHNMVPAREDIQFVIGHQWDELAEQRRRAQKKPVITVNRLPAFIGQFLGAFLQSDTSIKLMPTRGGTKKVAEIRQGIIRTIMRTNGAKLARKVAAANQYICGQGNFMIEVCDSEYDVFLRDIRLKSLEDPFQVIWDRASVDPTGADAQHCFVFDYMTRDDFEKAYPEFPADAGWYTDDLDATVMTEHGWDMDEMIRVCQFWQMKREDVTLALEADSGDVIDVTGMPEDEVRAVAAIDKQGNPMVRDTVRPYAECHVISTSNVLEKAYRLNIPRLPVFRCQGWTLFEGAVQHRWGFIRHAKDPQRIHNFWRSILAEELMKSPAAKWLIDEAGDKNGLAAKFRAAHRSGDNVLTWDSQAGGMKPEYLAPPPINQAVLTEASMTVNDIRDVTNRHEASMGQVSNEVSGKAISARQRVSELGDVIYTENMNMALAEAGRVINELIPQIYDTQRVVKITGEDDEEELQAINDDFGDATPDITKGKYDMTYSTGPSYATKRQESVDIILTMMNHMPQLGQMAGDIIFRNLDVPGADELEERMALMLPEGMIDPEKLTGRRKERYLQLQEQRQQAQAQQQQIAEFFQMLQAGDLSADIAEKIARAMKQEADATKTMSEVGVAAAKVENEEDKLEIDAAKVGAQIDQQGIDMVQAGLAAAAAERQEQQQRQAAAQPQTQQNQNSGEQNG